MPRNSKRKSKPESSEFAAEFSVRQLAEVHDSEASVSDDLSMHRRGLSVLAHKFRSLKTEVQVSQTMDTAMGLVRVRGRIDALRKTRYGVALVEIKSRATLDNPSELRSASRQLQLYGELYEATVGDVANLELVALDSRGRIECLQVPRCEFENATKSRVATVLSRRRFLPWVFGQKGVVTRVLRSEKGELREQQRALLRELSRTCSSRAIISAPPGSGKTRVALHAVLEKALVLDRPVLWITHTANGRLVVLNEIDRLNNLGCNLQTAWHTPSVRLCGCSDPQSCEKFAKTDEHLFWTGTADELGADACSYRVERHREKSAHVIIADVNYLLLESPLAHREYVAVVDEIHNLGRRIRDLSSVTVSREQLAFWIKSLPRTHRGKFGALLKPEWHGEHLAFDPIRLFNDLLLRLRRIAPGQTSLIRLQRVEDARPQFTDSHLAWHLRSGAPEERFADWLSDAPHVIGLTGSLPLSRESQSRAIPQIRKFELIAPDSPASPPVVFVPALRMRFPLGQVDLDSATEILCRVIDKHGPCCLVFAPNEPTCELLELRLRARGKSVWLDKDVQGDSLTKDAMACDFLVAPLGGRLAESINPEDRAFSCGVMLSCGYRPIDMSSEVEDETSDRVWKDEVADAAARVVQAVGRLHRHPESGTLVYLLDEAFLEKQWCDEWPAHWKVIAQPHFLDE